MEYPFFTDPWARFGPAYHSRPHPYYTQANQRPSPPPKPKVISIPVFDAADSAAAAAKRPAPDLSASAIKIQKAFRGFLVRKNMRTIRKIATEAEEIAALIAAASEDEEAPVRRDAKERLRLGEMLMALLLRLDSVRGVREYRKKVIRRVIQLQEAVDSIAATPPPNRGVEAPESTIEDGNAAASEAVEAPESMMANETPTTESAEAPESTIVNETEASDLVVEEGKVEEEEDVMDVIAPVSEPMGSGVVDDVMGHSSENQIEKEQREPLKEEMSGGAENGVMMREMMERVAAESGRMKEMVAELCEQSAKQCQLMGALARRVEQLEDKVERMDQKRRKKKSRPNKKAIVGKQ